MTREVPYKHAVWSRRKKSVESRVNETERERKVITYQFFFLPPEGTKKKKGKSEKTLENAFDSI